MAGTPSRKPPLREILINFFLVGKTLKGFFWAALILAVLFIINQVILPRAGYRLRIDTDGLRFGDFAYYSGNESIILGVLVNDTPSRGNIPQREYIQSRTGLNKTDLEEAIQALAEKGDLMLGESGKIVRAYPWSESSALEIFLIADQDSVIGPLGAAGAFNAMSVAPLLGLDTRIEAKLKDTGERLVIEIGNNQIVYVSRITAVLYKTEEYENSAFYSSPEAIEEEYSGQYDIDKVIRIDRALVIGEIIAREIKDKIDR